MVIAIEVELITAGGNIMFHSGRVVERFTAAFCTVLNDFKIQHNDFFLASLLSSLVVNDSCASKSFFPRPLLLLLLHHCRKFLLAYNFKYCSISISAADCDRLRTRNE